MKKESWVKCSQNELHDARLSGNDPRVLLHIKYRYTYLNSQGKDYFESFETIGTAVNISERSMSRIVDHLVSCGYIRLTRRGRGTYLYEFL